MFRRVLLWLAVCSLAGLGFTHVVAAVTGMVFGGGFTYFTPGSVSVDRAMQIINACSFAETLFMPVATLSAAGYMLLLDRAVRPGSPGRGFEVQSLEGSGGGNRGVGRGEGV